MPTAVHYLPLATTCVALAFAAVVLRRYKLRGGLHLLWWGIGLATYAVGTATESWTTLFGWNPVVFKAWYISGALLGGAPLAQGTVYLLFDRTVAHRLAVGLVAALVLASSAVLLSPLDLELVEPHRLSGRVLEWTWVRMLSPLINLYAVTFLIGGAIVSAARYRRDPATRRRFAGNVFIAAGAILPGIGGVYTRLGHTEVLYVTELVGLLIIFAGYSLAISAPKPTYAEATS